MIEITILKRKLKQIQNDPYCQVNPPSYIQ